MRTSRLVLRWLRIAGTITWTVIAATFLFVLDDVPAILGDGQWILWATLTGFLALFWLNTDPEERLAARWRCASLALQSLCALGIAWLPRKPVGFIFLTLVLSLQASYAAPLILLAQNRQESRDRVQYERDRDVDDRTRADMEYLAREVASLRMSLGEVATRDFLRSELRALLLELDAGPDRVRDTT